MVYSTKQISRRNLRSLLLLLLVFRKSWNVAIGWSLRHLSQALKNNKFDGRVKFTEWFVIFCEPKLVFLFALYEQIKFRCIVKPEKNEKFCWLKRLENEWTHRGEIKYSPSKCLVRDLKWWHHRSLFYWCYCKWRNRSRNMTWSCVAWTRGQPAARQQWLSDNKIAPFALQFIRSSFLQ
jgi:hypothetical protein